MILSTTRHGKIVHISGPCQVLIPSYRYSDNDFEYRHVQLPKAMLKVIPKDYFADANKGLLKLLWEEEWRGLGITQVQITLCGT